MRELSLAILLAVGMASLAGPVAACSVFVPPAGRLSNAHMKGFITAAALVRVLKAEYTSARISDAPPWQADALVEQILLGSHAGKVVSFQRGPGSAACDEGYPLPRPGQQWVVYFGSFPDGREVVRFTYPADVAFAADPIFSHGPSSSRSVDPGTASTTVAALVAYQKTCPGQQPRIEVAEARPAS
jgi:hypothetical protein